MRFVLQNRINLGFETLGGTIMIKEICLGIQVLSAPGKQEQTNYPDAG
jgi:hypothetical protein